MIPNITLTEKEQELGHLVLIVSNVSNVPRGILTTAEKKYLKAQVLTFKQNIVSFNRLSHWVFFFVTKETTDLSQRLEASRKAGDTVAGQLNSQKATRVTIFDVEGNSAEILAFAEGMALGSYQFLKYKKEKEKENSLKEIEIYSKSPEEMRNAACLPDRRGFGIEHLNILLQAVGFCRDLINEPNSYLTARVFSREV